MRPDFREPGLDSDTDPCRMRPHSHPSRAVLGVVVIAVGVLALLANLNFIDAHALEAWWPMALVVFGLTRIFTRDWRASPIGGSVLVVVGLALTAQNLGYVRLDWNELWPALVIFGGVMMVLRSTFPHRFHRYGRRGGRFRGRHGRFRQSQIDHGNAIAVKSAFSATSLRNDSQDFQGGDIDLSLAGLELDLRQASIVESADLRISAMMSGIEIRVPLDWQVVIHGSPTMGGIEDRTIPPMNPTKRLVIHAEIVMGGLDLRN